MVDEKQRNCPACQDPRSIELGEKNGFQMLGCKNCRSIYSSFLSVGEDSENYDEYYTEKNLKVPSFIHKRLEEIIEEWT